MGKARKKIGLALGSGAARGWAHIGVVRALARLGIHPDVVAGCSIGALVGAAYAAGELDSLEEWVRGFTRLQVMSLLDPAFSGGLFRGDKVFGIAEERVGELTFDHVSDNPRDREVAVRLILGRNAEACNNQPVELRLDESVDGTSHYTRYLTMRYTIRRSFTSEFDF